MPRCTICILLLACAVSMEATSAAQQSVGTAAEDDHSTGQPVRSTFRVRYVGGGSVYLDAGRNAGLSDGMKLVIKASPIAMASGESSAASEPGIIAHLTVVSVADTSAVCEIVSTSRDVRVGDIASLPQDELEKLVAKRALSNTRQYPAVVSFTEGDPLDEDVREVTVPAPPLPEVNEARGRIGFDFSSMHSSQGQWGSSSNQLGVVFRADMTRIAGTYWNLSGYWRGRINSSSSTAQPTIQDLVNRTYHLSLTYANPRSAWVAGFGRMYLPWASSLETIDGGYIGRRVAPKTTAGLFAGSTPDPTSWSYNPDCRIGGSFINFDGGDFDAWKYSSTFGVGVSTLRWTIDRPFFFAENTVSLKRAFSVYYALQVDRPRVDPSLPPVGVGLSRSSVSIRIQPHPRLSFDLNHNYFRDVPTFDPQLVGTGLLDKYLFQGISTGVRAEMPRHITFYSNLGRSKTSSDAQGSWNTMFGVTKDHLWRGLRADLRYSKFTSAFAQGSYRSLSLSRNFGEGIRLEVQGGSQRFASPLATDNGSKFVNANLDILLRAHYFMQAGFTFNRGLQNYDQLFMTFGYRFDNRSRKHKEALNVAQK